jgi:hypothetical protein
VGRPTVWLFNPGSSLVTIRNLAGKHLEIPARKSMSIIPQAFPFELTYWSRDQVLVWKTVKIARAGQYAFDQLEDGQFTLIEVRQAARRGTTSQ